ncbi:30S ribosomal protein S15 [Candidatus Gracilibacteria bacterium]|jgi:small subunit ribosomal protein S15|nr:30S ribosomal protein S15 [Candidatus Gracilibacteria bacterium]MBP7806353.1 30S ribosomal protein S15 [Candidatus Gracilibacteria bacterium]
MKHDQKKEIISKYAREKGDTGSPEVQIALLSVRIEALTAHLNEHKKDNHSRRGLLGLVQKRRRLKNYLQKSNPEAFKKITEELDNIKAAEKAAKVEKTAALKKTKTDKKAEKKAAPKAEKAEKKAPAKKTAKKK